MVRAPTPNPRGSVSGLSGPLHSCAAQYGTVRRGLADCQEGEAPLLLAHGKGVPPAAARLHEVRKVRGVGGVYG